jgi:hypothetical protein
MSFINVYREIIVYPEIIADGPQQYLFILERQFFRSFFPHSLA